MVYDRLQMMSGSFQVPFLIYSGKVYSDIAVKIHEGPLVKILSKTSSLAEILQAAESLLAN